MQNLLKAEAKNGGREAKVRRSEAHLYWSAPDEAVGGEENRAHAGERGREGLMRVGRGRAEQRRDRVGVGRRERETAACLGLGPFRPSWAVSHHGHKLSAVSSHCTQPPCHLRHRYIISMENISV